MSGPNYQGPGTGAKKKSYATSHNLHTSVVTDETAFRPAINDASMNNTFHTLAGTGNLGFDFVPPPPRVISTFPPLVFNQHDERVPALTPKEAYPQATSVVEHSMRLTAGSNPSHAPNLSPPIVAQFARLPEDILHQHAGYNGGTSDTSLSLAFQGPNYPRGSLPNVAYISSTEHKTAAAHTATSQPKLRDQHPNKKRRIFDEEKNIEKPRRNPKQVQAEVNCKDRKTFAFNLLGTRLEEILEGECAVPEFMADRLNLATETLGDLEQQVKLRDRIIELYMQLDSILTEKARLLEAITQARAEKEWILIGNLMASD